MARAARVVSMLARPLPHSKANGLLRGMILVAMIAPAAVQAQSVAISNLADFGFGTIANVSVDTSLAKNICVYSNTNPSRYSVRATGSGAAGAFTISNGATALAYEVQWAASANQTSGMMLTSGSTLSGLASSAGGSSCALGFAPSASLIIVLRSAAVSTAQAGSYTGTLTLLISPN